MGVQVHEFNADLFERAMTEEVPFYPRQGLVWVVVGLLYQR